MLTPILVSVHGVNGANSVWYRKGEVGPAGADAGVTGPEWGM
jgi:hypothetical protein